MYEIMGNNSFLWRRKIAMIVVTVITANVYATHAQSYLLAIGQNPHIYFQRQVIHHPHLNRTANDALTGLYGGINEQQDDQNSTLIVIKKAVNTSPSELSQAAMDVITIVWYVATFLALAAFFLLMACSERRCSTSRRMQAGQNAETPNPPPTPSPSYSEFAPPSYESVMKMDNISGIYVIPFPLDEEKNSNNNEANDENGSPNSAVTFYTINELQKL